MFVGISSYLRHSESVSAKHYDFSNIEKSARNRAAVVDLIGGKYSNRSSSQLCRLVLNRQSADSTPAIQLFSCFRNLRTGF